MWGKLDELEELANTSSPEPSRRASSPSTGLATAQVTLRNLFGINARADVMLYLLSGATGSSAGIARATWFDQKAVSWDVTLTDPRSNPGEEYFQPAAAAVLAFVSKMAGE